MKIKTQDIRDFQRMAVNIKTNELLPIYAYLRFENNTITKNNLQQFVIRQIQHEGSFLILESILFNFVNQTNDDEIEIIIGPEITIRDSKISVKSPSEPVINFPVNDSQHYDPIILPAELIEAIFVVEKMTTIDDILPFKGTVFVYGSAVIGSDGFVGAAKYFPNVLPTMVLPKMTAKVVGGLLDQVSFSENDSYHFFHSGLFKFGFVKSHVSPMNLAHLFQQPNQQQFLIDKNELLKFNKFCLSLNRELPICNWDGPKITMKKSAYSIEAETTISAYCQMESVVYNAEFFNRILEVIPGDTIKIHSQNHALCITNESEYLCLLMCVKQQ